MTVNFHFLTVIMEINLWSGTSSMAFSDVLWLYLSDQWPSPVDEINLADSLVGPTRVPYDPSKPLTSTASLELIQA